MTIEYVAIWTKNLKDLRNFYVSNFDAISSQKYQNHSNGFESYFLTFESGARLELMQMPGIPENVNDTIEHQHLGLIHIAFGLPTRDEVDSKARELKARGITILSGPRMTGDGYYEFEALDLDNNRIEVTSMQ